MAAAGYTCMAEGTEHAANWLLSSLDPYAMFTACSEDFPLMIIPVLAHNLQTDPDRLYDAIRKHVDAENRKQAKAAKAAETVSPQTEPEQPPTLGPSEQNNGGPVSESSTSSDSLTSRSDQVTA